MRILKTVTFEGWAWRVIRDSSGLGIQAKSNFGWDTYDEVFSSPEEAITFAHKTATRLILDAEVSKLSNGVL